jgi:hypothetical protein
VDVDSKSAITVAVVRNCVNEPPTSDVHCGGLHSRPHDENVDRNFHKYQSQFSQRTLSILTAYEKTYRPDLSGISLRKSVQTENF